MKITVIGYSAGGKSTLAKNLGALYCAPVLHLDRVHFSTGWKERDHEEALALVRAFMAGGAWVIDGNYRSLFQRERLESADRIVFLDFNRFNCLFRALRRYFSHRGTVRDSAADGCIEKMDWEFIWWILYKGRTRAIRKHYKAVEKEYSNKLTVLKNQRQLDAFCLSIPKYI